MRIRFGTCEVRRLNWALDGFTSVEKPVRFFFVFYLCFLVRCYTLLFQYLMFALFYVIREFGRFLHRGRAHDGYDLKIQEIKPAIVNQQREVYKFQCKLCGAGYVGYTCRHLYR